jgi:solute carrier family 9 (sodium/hydrogen exchanger), member 6/7
MNSMSSSSAGLNTIVRRDLDPEDPSNAIQDELYSSWALLILVVLLIATLWMSYYLQLKKIRAFHETVVSIFGGNITSFCSVWLMAGMIVGLIIRVSPGMMIQNMVSFKYSVFFNFLLPPIILNSGYELHQVCIRLKLLISGKLLP